MQIFLENLDKFHTILIKSPIWWGFLTPSIVFSGFNFCFMVAEIIKGMPCLSGDENLKDSWGALKITYIVFLIPILLVTIILQFLFPNGLPPGREVPGQPGVYYNYRGAPFIPATIEEQKVLSLVILGIILLSIILTVVFKILIYYKTKKNNKSSTIQQRI